MANKNRSSSGGADKFPSKVNGTPAARPLHRLAAVRKAKGISLREMADRLKISVNEVQRQEQETANLPLRTVCRWAKALGTPVTALLIDADPVLQSAHLRPDQALRLMETVRAIRRQARRPSVQRMAQTLMEQLLEIAPELEDIGLGTPVASQGEEKTEGPGRRHLPESIFLDQQADG